MTIKHRLLFLLLTITFAILIYCALSMGPASVSGFELLGFGRTHLSEDIFSHLFQYRWAKILTAIFACGGLGISGLLMQSYFRNPMAGPDLFGISSGASLGVASSLLFEHKLSQLQFFNSYSLGFGFEVLFAFLGAVSAFLFMIFISKKEESQKHSLIIGILLSSFLSGIMAIVYSYFQDDALKQMVSWGFGSFEKIDFYQAIPLFVIVCGLSILTFFLSDALNLFYVSEKFSQSHGLDLKRFRWSMIFLGSLMTAIITASVGPLSFVGIITFHLSKFLFKTYDYKILIPSTFLLGSIIGLIVVVILSMEIFIPIPTNAILGFVSAPILIVFLTKNSLFHKVVS